MIDTTKKATMATVKAFVRKNRPALMIDTESRFDGMDDSVRACSNRGFSPIREDRDPEYTLGIAGAWFVGSSRDYITPFVKEGFEGYRIYNCCGSFSLAVRA